MPARRPPRVIELITVLALGGILVAVLLPRCSDPHSGKAGKAPAAVPVIPQSG